MKILFKKNEYNNICIQNVFIFSSTWDYGRPDLINGDCLLMRNNGTYTNENCYDEKPFFCERKMGIATFCDVDSGWEPVSGICIKVSTQKLTWPSARSECLNSGGDLVVSKSDEILYYLKDYNKFYNLKFWIGYSDLVSDLEIEKASCLISKALHLIGRQRRKPSLGR